MRVCKRCAVVLVAVLGLWGEAAAESVRPGGVANVRPEAPRTDRTIGECRLVNTIKESRGVDQWKSPIYSINPVETVNAYFAIIEKRNIGLEGKIALLQGPEHGAMKEEWNQNYRYIQNSDYLGSDRAIFLVEIGGLKVKVVYHFKVIDGGAIGGTEADDKQNCPKGMFWKISTTSDASGNLIVSSVDYQTPITNAARTRVRPYNLHVKH